MWYDALDVTDEAQEEITRMIREMITRYNGTGILKIEIRRGQVYRVGVETSKTFELRNPKGRLNSNE